MDKDKPIIRSCLPSDYEKIHKLNKNGLGYDFPVELTKERLSLILTYPNNRIFVALIGGEVIGYIHAADYDCTYSEPVKNILAIVVDEAYRGRGIGKTLLCAAEDWAKECGCCGVRLVSSEFRTDAHAFYLRCGYTDRKMQKNFLKLFY